ncbi:hypothetical protein Pint_02654 [Pistacia integerrima]|uniref:Uncharacterized protein n=1 Tax=Pistacia integerrima TaxID=434235 RepID=A0ACC0ZLG5_9ROSI|nr:hypothetical protein Pint_02654 [Pistacia integerrima]
MERSSSCIYCWSFVLLPSLSCWLLHFRKQCR